MLASAAKTKATMNPRAGDFATNGLEERSKVANWDLIPAKKFVSGP